jgi:hypothetical protein
METMVDAVLDAPGDPLDNWIARLPLLLADPAYAEMIAMRKLAVTIADVPQICEALRAGTERLTRRTERAVRRSQQLGAIRADVDPDDVAWTWLGLMLAGSYRKAIGHEGGFSAILPAAVAYLTSLKPASASASAT